MRLSFQQVGVSFKFLIVLAAFFVSQIPAISAPLHFDGAAAFAATAHATSFGERPAGSEALVRLRQWIVSQLKPLGGQLSLDSFKARTPDGIIPITNIILKFPGISGKAIVISGHYDTKRIPMAHFVGADDGGSSTGFLIEFARMISKSHHPDDIYIVFFDGEEALREWTATDSVYGSRHLAQKWGADGTLARIKALLNIDMIGDKDLDLSEDSNSSQSLRDLMYKSAAALNDSAYFPRRPSPIEDDHMPFVEAGVNSLDVIDLDYKYWHTGQDTMDKLSEKSFQIVGDVVTRMVEQLESK